MPKKLALHVSLAVIIIYWIYELFVAKTRGVSTVNFSDFVIKIAIIKILHLSVIILLLKSTRDSWHDMGFDFKNLKKQIIFGLLMGLLMFIFVNVGLTSVLNSMFQNTGSSGGILKYFSDPNNLFIWLAIGVFGGGVVEEVMRIFMLTRFEKRFGTPGLYFALICSSIIFGMGHLYQGTGSAIATGLTGLILGIIYIKRRSAIELITIHAFSDVLAILLAYQLAGQQSQ